MSFTTLRMSLPLALAEITILRFTFSRFIVFGPMPEVTSATLAKGTFRPSGVSIMRSRMRSMSQRSCSAARTTKLKLPPFS